MDEKVAKNERRMRTAIPALINQRKLRVIRGVTQIKKPKSTAPARPAPFEPEAA